jgi:hypothetical protein
MRYFRGFLCLLCSIALLTACSRIEDKDGNALRVGEHYRMASDGLEHVPRIMDKSGTPVVIGKEYVMTADGLELITHLKDKHGCRVEVGNEYLMTGEGLKLTVSRGIKGAVQDASGKALPGVEVTVVGSDRKTSSSQDGSFTFPFIEGYVRFHFKVPGLPDWCTVDDIEEAVVTRDRYPAGWDIGVIRVPCVLAENQEGGKIWMTADGRFIDNGDGTISDAPNGLLWEAEVKSQRIPWTDAENYATELDLAGHRDWRLPTPEELETLREGGVACAMIGTPMIQGALNLWTSDHVDDSALVHDICTGRTRKSVGLDEGPHVNASALAVRNLK